jgi:hypothetical protein
LGKPRAFQIPGVSLWFNSHDHLPPHFHAERAGEWRLRVRFMKEQDEMFEIVWATRQPSSRTLRSIAVAVRQHAPELLAEWNRKVNVTCPGPARQG